MTREAGPTEDEPIEQGYVAIDPDGTEVRVRQRGDTTVLTVKSGPGEGLRARARDLGGGLRATVRAHRAAAGATPPHDRGGGAGSRSTSSRVILRGSPLVEVEFGSEAEAAAFEPPDWFGRELTGMDEYANVNLARDGLPEPS